MAAADATLLANPSGDETMLQQTIAREQTMLEDVSMLANDTLLAATGVKRSAAGDNMDLGIKVIQVGKLETRGEQMRKGCHKVLYLWKITKFFLFHL